MKLLAKAKALLQQNPLPNDAPEQLDVLIAQASGMEKQLIKKGYEALHAAATPEQYQKWFALDEEQ